MGLDITKLKGKIPESVYNELPTVISKFSINTINRMVHFLGQCSHESNNFKVTKENLNYSAQGLANTFSSRFAVDLKAKIKIPNALAKSIERNPELIANNVYCDRMGNGNTVSGDGFKYSGKGYIQLTGKDNYTLFDKAVDDDILKNPDLVATKYPLTSAGFFWYNNGLNKLADVGITDSDITKVTKKINGATIGLTHRIELTKGFYNLLK